MSRYSPPEPNPRRLYRYTDNSMLAGVCAGIGDYFGFSVTAIRWIVALSCLFAIPAVFVCYVVAALMLPRKPVGL
jgi:phage shock protein C